MEMLFGLKKGTSAPNFFEIFAYFFELVETKILLNKLLFFAARIVWAIKGSLDNLTIFLFFILSDPCLAGIRAIILCRNFFLFIII